MPHLPVRLQSSLQDQACASGAKTASFFLTSAPARDCRNFCAKKEQTGFLQRFQNRISFPTALSTKNGHNCPSLPFSSTSKQLFFMFFNLINTYPRWQKENSPWRKKFLFCAKSAQKRFFERYQGGGKLIQNLSTENGHKDTGQRGQQRPAPSNMPHIGKQPRPTRRK